MKKIIYLLYGIICYYAFIGCAFFAIAFTGNFIVAKTIDSEPEMPLFESIIINLFLLVLFILQLRGFRQGWVKIIPVTLQRSTYVLLVSVCLMLLMWQWQPVGGIIWLTEDEVLKALLQIIYFSGWSIVLVTTFLMNHSDLFGLRQVWLYFKGNPYTPVAIKLPFFYKLVRRPMYFGFLIACWSAPVMTVAHLLFAISVTLYVLRTIFFEEKRVSFFFMFTK